MIAAAQFAAFAGSKISDKISGSTFYKKEWLDKPVQLTLVRAQRGRRADTIVVPRQHTGLQFHAQMGCSRDVQDTRILHGFRRRM